MIPIAKPWLDEAEEKAAQEVIRSGWIIQGPKVEALEKQFANYVGAEYAVAVSSGTAALHLALLTLDLEEGDEVICPSLSYIATAYSPQYVKATPVFADVEEDTMNLSLADVERKITDRTKAVLLVHQVGYPAKIEDFQELCERHGLTLIEDSACALGSSIDGQRIGSSGYMNTFSFHPRKIISTGDGGMITLNDEKLAARLKRLRQHGMSKSASDRHKSGKTQKEAYTEMGFNYRLTDIQAAVGIEQMNKMPRIMERRIDIAETYNQVFSKCDDLILPRRIKGAVTNYQSYVIRLKFGGKKIRDEMIEYLKESGVSTRPGIMTAHREPAFDEYSKADLPNSVRWSDESLCLPLYVEMSSEEVTTVIDGVLNFFKS